jgi:hypothetical protein
MEKTLKLRFIAGFAVITTAVTAYAGYLIAQEPPCEAIYIGSGQCGCKGSLSPLAIQIIEEREANLKKYHEEHPEAKKIEMSCSK